MPAPFPHAWPDGTRRHSEPQSPGWVARPAQSAADALPRRPEHATRAPSWARRRHARDRRFGHATWCWSRTRAYQRPRPRSTRTSSGANSTGSTERSDRTSDARAARLRHSFGDLESTDPLLLEPRSDLDPGARVGGWISLGPAHRHLRGRCRRAAVSRLRRDAIVEAERVRSTRLSC